jgi:hypothetical protein
MRKRPCLRTSWRLSTKYWDGLNTRSELDKYVEATHLAQRVDSSPGARSSPEDVKTDRYGSHGADKSTINLERKMITLEKTGVLCSP